MANEEFVLKNILQRLKVSTNVAMVDPYMFVANLVDTVRIVTCCNFCLGTTSVKNESVTQTAVMKCFLRYHCLLLVLNWKMDDRNKWTQFSVFYFRMEL